MGSVSLFEGVLIGSGNFNKSKQVIEIPKLKLTKITVSQTGKMEIIFNRKILKPKIKIDGSSSAVPVETD